MQIYLHLVSCTFQNIKEFQHFSCFANTILTDYKQFTVIEDSLQTLSLVKEGFHLIICDQLDILSELKNYQAEKIWLYDTINRQTFLRSIQLNVAFWLKQNLNHELELTQINKLIHFVQTETPQGKLLYASHIETSSLGNLVSFIKSEEKTGVLYLRVNNIPIKLYFVNGNLFALIGQNRFCKNTSGYTRFFSKVMFEKVSYYTFIELNETIELLNTDIVALEYILLGAAKEDDEAKKQL